MHPEGGLEMRTFMFVLAAIGGITGGSVWAVGDSLLPKPEPVSFIAKAEATCPNQRLSPTWDYRSPCVQRTVMSFFDYN